MVKRAAALWPPTRRGAWFECARRAGFTPPLSLLELLRRRGRIRAEDLARLDLAEPIDLHEVKRAWLSALDSVEPFVASRSAEELGCLYFSASMRAFVDPRQATDAVRHFGRPGGVLPRIAES